MTQFILVHGTTQSPAGWERAARPRCAVKTHEQAPDGRPPRAG